MIKAHARSRRRCLPVLAASAAILAFTSACSRSQSRVDGTSEEISLQASDHSVIKATLYTVPTPRPSALILVPMLGGERKAWAAFAAKAQRAGLMCLAVDFRPPPGVPDKTRASVSFQKYDRQTVECVLLDIDAAKHALLERGADPDNIALVGASVGANLALRYAVDHPNIPAVVLLSPGLDYHGITTEDMVAALGKRPVLLMTSTGDAYAAASSRALKKTAPGFSELREYEGAAHGTDLLDRSIQANEQILLWLSQIIGPLPYPESSSDPSLSPAPTPLSQ